MDATDQILYITCWVSLLGYILSTLSAFSKGSCYRRALAFLEACALAIYMMLFNARFLLPSFMGHVHELGITTAELSLEYLRYVLTSEAAWDIYLMMLGSFGSWLAVYNAANMMNADGCPVEELDKCSRFDEILVKMSYRIGALLCLVDYETYASASASASASAAAGGELEVIFHEKEPLLEIV
ncbi:hypothetical protein GGR50DRAFT_698404 [Xylaria sp. CBS 124048]|nr:hypothetical protein GGR50DRAFT_698404 [Xylaria sp. CBS 124048]